MNFLINGVEKARLIFDERKCKNLSNKIKKDSEGNTPQVPKKFFKVT